MKIKIKELNPNPFKKEISKGRLNREQINKIKSNISELGFFGSLPIFKKGDKYHLIAGHHRLQALKEVYGNDHQVNVEVENYNQEQIFKAMVIENISQRGNEFMELNENIVAIENHLNKNKEILIALRESRKADSPMSRLTGSKEFEKATASDISYWIDKKKEDVISHDTITQHLNIYHKLDPKLRETVEKKHNKSKEERAEESLNLTQAHFLSSFEDKNEQNDLAKSIKDSREQRTREQGKLLSEYKKAMEETKKKVRDREMDLADVPIENLKAEIKKKIAEDKEKNKGKIIVTHYKQYQNEAGNKIGRTNKEILETCIYLNGLDKTGVLLQLDWKTMLKILESGTEHSKSYNRYMEKILSKIK